MSRLRVTEGAVDAPASADGNSDRSDPDPGIVVLHDPEDGDTLPAHVFSAARSREPPRRETKRYEAFSSAHGPGGPRRSPTGLCSIPPIFDETRTWIPRLPADVGAGLAAASPSRKTRSSPEVEIVTGLDGRPRHARSRPGIRNRAWGSARDIPTGLRRIRSPRGCPLPQQRSLLSCPLVWHTAPIRGVGLPERCV